MAALEQEKNAEIEGLQNKLDEANLDTQKNYADLKRQMDAQRQAHQRQVREQESEIRMREQQVADAEAHLQHHAMREPAIEDIH